MIGVKDGFVQDGMQLLKWFLGKAKCLKQVLEFLRRYRQNEAMISGYYFVMSD